MRWWKRNGHSPRKGWRVESLGLAYGEGLNFPFRRFFAVLFFELNLIFINFVVDEGIGSSLAQGEKSRPQKGQSSPSGLLLRKKRIDVTYITRFGATGIGIAVPEAEGGGRRREASCRAITSLSPAISSRRLLISDKYRCLSDFRAEGVLAVMELANDRRPWGVPWFKLCRDIEDITALKSSSFGSDQSGNKAMALSDEPIVAGGQRRGKCSGFTATLPH